MGRRAARRDSGMRRFCWWWSETVGRMRSRLPSAGLPRSSVSLLLATGGRRGWLLVSARMCSVEVAVRRGVAVLALARGAAVRSGLWFCLLAVRAWAARLSDSAWPDPVGSGGGRLDPAGSGLRRPGFGHVWRWGCSGPSLWWCRERCYEINSMLIGGGLLIWAKALLLPEPAPATPAGAANLLGGGVVMVTTPSHPRGNPCSKSVWNGRWRRTLCRIPS